MIKNKYTKEVIRIYNIDTLNNRVYITKKIDEYAIGIESFINIPNLYTKLNDPLSIKTGSCIYNDMIKCAETCLLELPEYSDYVFFESTPWDEPDWNYRFYINNQQSSLITRDYFSFVQSLYTEPKNPMFAKAEGTLIYAKVILEEARPLLEAMGITVEHLEQ